MKKILVPVDFSEYSEKALKIASKLAKKHNASIVALHMLGLKEAIFNKTSASDLEGLFHVQLAKKQFGELLEKDFLNGIQVEQIVKNYTVFTELGALAKQENIDLIIMGSHGANGISEIFVGSNTEKVVRTSEVPVLVIKDTTDFNISKAVFVSDFKTESLGVFKRALKLFKVLGVAFDLLYVNAPSEYFKSTSEIDQRIVDFSVLLKNDYKLIPEDVTIYNDYNVESGVFNYAKKHKADLICIPTHGRKGLAHFFSGSIGEDVANHSKLPVLTVKI